MSYHFELSEQPEQPVLSIRTVTTAEQLPAQFGKAFAALGQYLRELNATPQGIPFGAYYNMDMQRLDVEIGFPVAVPLPGNDTIQASVIPGGKQLSYLHKGSYQATAPVYEAMAQWIAQNGHTPTGVVYEFYLNSPAAVPESELLTKIVFVLT